MNEIIDIRRPIGARKAGWAHWSARKLAEAGVTPNRISIASMVFAAVGAAALALTGPSNGGLQIALLILAIIGIQARLLCNLFDGMVAVEHGSAGKDGAFWNEFPDRVSDSLLLTGAGLACGSLALGLAASALAIFVAYVRELGRATGLPADFGGPMAKQHRMAALTGAAVLAMLEPVWGGSGEVMFAALALILAGSVLTILLRARRLIAGLKRR
ncbi:MAG: CDP-alcohol phosphatidyltransferase family protein [Henriciella sp.]|uniref:CDP-alcohol phosphatidyltransferase family protein n=1 Tax=Henriciella sp. TaxID=1968823 RepID=UPI0032EC238E